MKDEKRTKQELINEIAWMRKQHHEYMKYENEQKKRIKQLKSYEDYLSALIENKEEEVEHRTWELGERVKELNCLFSISNLTEKIELKLDEILQGTVELIPPGWQYPEITYAKITFGNKEFQTRNYQKTEWEQESGIHVNDKRVGTIQVGYIEEKPEIYEGPFLKDERNLINAITGRMSHIIELKQMEQQIYDENEFLQIALDQKLMGTFLWNIEEGKIYLNRPFAELLGFSLKEDVDFIYTENFLPEDTKKDILKNIHKDKDLYQIEGNILNSEQKNTKAKFTIKVKKYSKNEPHLIKGVLQLSDVKK